VTTGDPFRTPYRGIPPGTLLNGIYQVDQIVGTGGMGEVYRGHELQTGATVAIKMLLPDVAENEAALALFRREASALLNLANDAIVRYFLFTVEPVLQRPYLAMEFIDGQSLSDMLAAGPLPFNDVVSLTQRVASGFQAAHERGIIHRDVSPDNIIIPRSGVTRAKIIDFGIARSTEIGDPTIIGDGFAGKHNYVSPEQVGLYGHEVTYKSDIYSLGLVLYHAVTGHKLDMGGNQFQIVEKRRRVPDLAGVEARVSPLLDRMLQPDPANRPATMAEVASWLAREATGAQPRATTGWEGGAVTAARGTGKRRWMMLSASAAAVLLLGGGSYALYAFVFATPGVNHLPPPKLTQNPPLSKPDLATSPPPGQQAALPPSTAKPPPATASPPAGRVDQIRDYVDKYDGGDCFLVLPVAISQTAAVIEGFGASADRFEAFRDAFRRDWGFGAALGLRQISQAQCPAIRFIKQLSTGRGRPPRVNLSKVELKSGDTMSGTIENISSGAVELLLITDSGQVQNLTSQLSPAIDSLSFAIGLQRNQPESAPQLLMAVATPQPLSALQSSQSVPADKFFAKALKDASDGNVSMTASARYFRLEK
jgi:serine/threonine protein kinase